MSHDSCMTWLHLVLVSSVHVAVACERCAAVSRAFLLCWQWLQAGMDEEYDVIVLGTGLKVREKDLRVLRAVVVEYQSKVDIAVFRTCLSVQWSGMVEIVMKMNEKDYHSDSYTWVPMHSAVSWPWISSCCLPSRKNWEIKRASCSVTLVDTVLLTTVTRHLQSWPVDATTPQHRPFPVHDTVVVDSGVGL